MPTKYASGGQSVLEIQDSAMNERVMVPSYFAYKRLNEFRREGGNKVLEALLLEAFRERELRAAEVIDEDIELGPVLSAGDVEKVFGDSDLSFLCAASAR